jgi:Signal transduction histidine kinase
MKASNRNTLSIILMISSLLLLLLFQLFWLKNEYSAHKEALLKEADYLLINTIRATEREMMGDLVGQTVSDTVNGVMFSDLRTREFAMSKILDSIPHHNSSLQILKSDAFMETDTTKIVSIFQSNVATHDERFANQQITINTQLSEHSNQLPGLLSMIVKLDNNAADSKLIDTLFQDSIVVQMVDKKFAEAMEKHQFNIDYTFSVNAQDAVQEDVFQTNTQGDFLTGQFYSAVFHNYQTYLIKQIWPQILFSILLFSCIALAFFMVYQSLQKQQRLTALKNDFISNVTHELKTPITTVGVAIEAMSNFDALQNPERTKEYLNISKHELNRLTILVDKVLKMSLFEKGEPELKMEMLDLKDLTQEILNSLKLQFERLAAKVEFQSNGSNFSLKGDRIHLTSVLYNLIDNALKYSPENPEIKIGLHHQENGLEIKVSDQGIGIASEYKDKIFEKFFRVPTGDAHNIKGYGLGLSYVASVIRKHQGNIEVDSEKGKGTTFILFLPYQQT